MAIQSGDERFKLFDQLPQDRLLSDGVVCALQSFETTFYLIGSGRWPSVIVTLFNGTELLLKAIHGDGLNSDALINQHLRSGFASRSLTEDVHRLRRIRNEIVHHGYSPRDDLKCAQAFLKPGIPFFSNLFERYFSADIRDCISTGNLWFWENIQSARKVVEKENGKENPNYKPVFGMLSMVCREVVGTAGIFNEFCSPYHGYIDEWVVQNNFEIEARARDSAIIETAKQFDCHGVDELIWMNVPCPVCRRSEVMASPIVIEPPPEDIVGNQMTGISELACVWCGYFIRDPAVIDAFFWSRVDVGKRRKYIIQADQIVSSAGLYGG